MSQGFSNNSTIIMPLSGVGAPTSTPTFVGQVYEDLTNNVWYLSNGTLSTANWILQNQGLLFGNPGAFDTAVNPASGNLHASKFTANRSGLLTHITLKYGTHGGGFNGQYAIYSNTSEAPNALLAQTASTAIASGDTDSFVRIELITPIQIVAGTRYWLAQVHNSNPPIERDGGVTVHGKYKSGVTINSLPNPFGAPTGNAEHFCISAWQSQ